MRNAIGKYVFRRNNSGPPPNVFIGGVSATINTPTLLANRLSINISDISNFTINGSDIECFVGVDYSINGFRYDTSITYWRDLDSYCKNVGSGGLANTTIYEFIGDGVTSLTNAAFQQSAIVNLYLPNLISIGTTATYRCGSLSTVDFPILTSIPGNSSGMFRLCPLLGYVNIPQVTNLGDSVLYTRMFENIKFGTIINANITLQTNNGGNPDGDLQYAINSRGATVNYIL